MASVKLDRVNKIYRSGKSPVHAVRDLDLEVRDGEFLALLGPSGCGKTSTLRMIVGLEGVTSGEISFDGRRVNELDPQARNVAMAFETYALYPNFNVHENLSFPLEAVGTPAGERDRRVREMAELLGIEDILWQRPGALSGGQQQRVSLGRALIREPAAFILDEVMSHIDAHRKFRMLFELKRIHRNLGRTMIYVTHDQVEALALADRIAVMSDSVLQQLGTRNELYRRPANLFVADFIGEPPTNFFPAELDRSAGGAALRVPDTELAFPVTEQRAEQLAGSGATALKVGVRPQNFRILGEEGEGLPAEVEISEYVGERVILTLRSGASLFRALADPSAKAGRGCRLRVACRPEDVMVFDGVSGRIIL